MTMAKKLPLLAPSIHTFEVNGTYTDCEAKRTVFMAIQKMVSAGKYYRIPYHGSSKKGYSYKRKDGGLTITLADYPDFKKRYITLSGVNLARIAGDPSRLSLTDLSPEGLVMQEQAFLDELEQLGLLEIEDSVKWKIFQLIGTTLFAVKGHGIRSIRNLFNVRVGKSAADAVYSFFPAHSFRQRKLTSVMLRAVYFFIDIIPEAKVDHCGDQKPQKYRYRSGTRCSTCHHAHNEPQQQPNL